MFGPGFELTSDITRPPAWYYMRLPYKRELKARPFVSGLFYAILWKPGRISSPRKRQHSISHPVKSKSILAPWRVVFHTPPFPECIGQAAAHKTEKQQRRINERNFSLNAKLSLAGFALSELRPYHTKGRSFVCESLFLTEASGAVFVCWVLIIEMHKQSHRCAHELESVCRRIVGCCTKSGENIKC